MDRIAALEVSEDKANRSPKLGQESSSVAIDPVGIDQFTQPFLSQVIAEISWCSIHADVAGCGAPTASVLLDRGCLLHRAQLRQQRDNPVGAGGGRPAAISSHARRASMSRGPWCDWRIGDRRTDRNCETVLL